MTTVYLIALAILIPSLWAWTSLAPWVPTDRKDLPRVNAAASLKPGALFVELGCGDGRVCSYVARQNPQARVVGIELNVYSYALAKLKRLLLGPRNLHIRFGDAMKYDISRADVLYTFALIQTVNGQIKQKVVREMKRGAKLISYAFAMKEWQGKTFHHEKQGATSIHVYQKP